MYELYDKALECKRVIGKYEDMSGVEKFSYVDTFTDDIAYIGYLFSSVDDKLDHFEISVINDCFGFYYEESDLNERYAKRKEVDKEDFLKRVPQCIIDVAKLEKQSYANMKCFLADTRLLYGFIKYFSMNVIMSNGKRQIYQMELYDKFCHIMLDYILQLEEEDIIEIQLEEVEKKNEDFEVNEIENIDNVNEILAEVDAMIGLENVKKEIHNMVNILIVRQLRLSRGYKIAPISMHLVLAGNPGTGKTTVARMIARVYKALGILKEGHLVETDRSGLVAGYMGQTAAKVKEVAKTASGGILFIDEAYTLSNGNEGDFGQEAIDTLLKIMEDERENLVVIVAGYPDKMEKFLSSNPGLRSRFNKVIQFEDYNIDQLFRIFIKMCEEQDYEIEEAAKDELKIKIAKLINEKKDDFANAREIRNYFEEIITRQATRITLSGSGKISNLLTITKEDL